MKIKENITHQENVELFSTNDNFRNNMKIVKVFAFHKNLVYTRFFDLRISSLCLKYKVKFISIKHFDYMLYL